MFLEFIWTWKWMKEMEKEKRTYVVGVLGGEHAT